MSDCPSLIHDFTDLLITFGGIYEPVAVIPWSDSFVRVAVLLSEPGIRHSGHKGTHLECLRFHGKDH